MLPTAFTMAWMEWSGIFIEACHAPCTMHHAPCTWGIFLQNSNSNNRRLILNRMQEKLVIVMVLLLKNQVVDQASAGSESY